MILSFHHVPSVLNHIAVRLLLFWIQHVNEVGSCVCVWLRCGGVKKDAEGRLKGIHGSAITQFSH